MTPNDLITLALKRGGINGVGQTPSADDMNDAFTELNMMLGEWSRKRWIVYHLIDVSKVATGAQSYTVGSGGDFNTTRPDRVEAAFFRQIVPSTPSQVDYPLTILQSREDYNRISLKALNSWPEFLFYDSDYPLGRVYVWPVPSSNYEIHLSLKATLAQFSTLSDTITFPPEYLAALLYNLASRLREAYQMPVSPKLESLAKDALNVLRGANTQIPRLEMPTEVQTNGMRYNIFSDQGG